LEAVLKEMPAGLVIAKAPSGEVMLANHQAKEILQRSIGELRSVGEYAGYQLFRLSGQPYGLEEQPLARSVLHGEVVMGEELKYLRPDGTFRVLLANSAPVRNETGAIVASVVAFQDITDLRVAQEELLRERNDVIHDLAGRLITAQEEERKRIARELHDDICQKLAMLSIELEQTNGDSEGLPTVTKKLAWKSCGNIVRGLGVTCKRFRTSCTRRSWSTSVWCPPSETFAGSSPSNMEQT
jgi:signal transduction histidine kinase